MRRTQDRNRSSSQSGGLGGDVTEGLWIAWQPVVDLTTGTVMGHEALIRGPRGSVRETPAQLFSEAATAGRTRELEVQCRQLALDALFQDFPADQMLFLNLDITMEGLPIDPLGRSLPCAQIALELSERHAIEIGSAALARIERWRQEGYRIVLDDYGAGFSSLGMALTVHPHMLKLDRTLIQAIDRDPFRQKVLRSVSALWHDMGVMLIGEGIETAEELATLQDLGIEYGQGFYLSRPAPLPLGPTLIPLAKHARRQPVFYGLYAPIQVWSDGDQEYWKTTTQPLQRLHELFVDSLPTLIPKESLMPDATPQWEPLLKLAPHYGVLLPLDPRNPTAREEARRLGRQHVEQGLSVAWYVSLYTQYFSAYHHAEKEGVRGLPPLDLFRRRWVWDVADTLDAYNLQSHKG